MIKIPLLFQCLIRVVIQETIITRITAPMIEGTNAMPARLGPSYLTNFRLTMSQLVQQVYC